MPQLLDLPDDILELVAIHLSPVDFVRFQRTNQRLKEHLSQPTVFEKLVKANQIPDPYRDIIKSLEKLHVFHQVRGAGLLEENRVGFQLGRLEINRDYFEDELDETDVKGSQRRMLSIKELLRRNPKLSIRVDSHCGTACRSHETAIRFSVYRGEILLDELSEFVGGSMSIVPWGKRAAEAASRSNHRFATSARAGKGWAEIRIGIVNEEEEFLLPLLPDFYEELQPFQLHQEEEEEQDTSYEVPRAFDLYEEDDNQVLDIRHAVVPVEDEEEYRPQPHMTVEDGDDGIQIIHFSFGDEDEDESESEDEQDFDKEGDYDVNVGNGHT